MDSAAAIGNVLGTGFGVLLLLTVFAVVWSLPFMAISAARNIKKIRIELERLNETLSSKMTITKSGPLGL